MSRNAAADRIVIDPSMPRVRRSARYTPFVGGGGLLVVVLLFALPYLVYSDVTTTLTSFLVLLVLATMWNLLAGFGGLVSIGQQAYIGIGAYAVLALTDRGVNPWLAVAGAAAISAVVAVPTSWLAFRLRGDYFAVGTWVIAEVYRLLTVKVPGLGGASGRPFTALSGVDPRRPGCADVLARGGRRRRRDRGLLPPAPRARRPGSHRRAG